MTKEDKQPKSISILGYSPLVIIIAIGLLVFFTLTPKGDLNIDNEENAEIEDLVFFTSSDLIIDANVPQYNNGLAFFNYDFDDEQDFFITGYNGSINKVLEIEDSTLKEISSGEFIKTNTIGLATCDVDSDGVEELFLSTGNFESDKKEVDYLYDFIDGQWINIYPDNFGKTNGRDVVCLDYNGDQRYEFLQIDKNASIRHIGLDQSGNLKLINDKSGLEIISTGEILLTVPILGSAQDVLVSNDGIGNVFFRNNGDATLEIFNFNENFENLENELRGISYIDANNDMSLDLIFANKFGFDRFLIQQDDSFFRDIFESKNLDSNNATSVLTFDYDLNGFEDVLLLSKDKTNELLISIGDGFDPLPIGDLLEDDNITGGLVGLINDNNRPDILLGHENRKLSYYESFENSNQLISIEALTKYGAPARGAIVHVYLDDQTQTKVVDPGSGRLSQQAPIIHFGYVDGQTIEKIEVVFPSGNKKSINIENIENFVTITDD